jgi:hypothetical protein
MRILCLTHPRRVVNASILATDPQSHMSLEYQLQYIIELRRQNHKWAGDAHLGGRNSRNSQPSTPTGGSTNGGYTFRVHTYSIHVCVCVVVFRLMFFIILPEHTHTHTQSITPHSPAVGNPSSMQRTPSYGIHSPSSPFKFPSRDFHYSERRRLTLMKVLMHFCDFRYGCVQYDE